MRFAGALASVSLVLLVAASPASGQGFLDKLRDTGRQLGIGDSGTGSLSDAEIGSGLREALKVGTERLVAELGKKGGFYDDPQVHIPLPGPLREAQSTLKRFGLSGMADDLERRLNRAAEEATPKARKLFWNAISRMSLTDARKILNGPDNAATEYFRTRMTKPLKAEFRPIVDRSLADVGAIKSYDALMGRYEKLPFVPDAKSDLVGYVLDKAIDGIFLYLGKEEAAIRKNPAKRTTALLRKVFAK